MMNIMLLWCWPESQIPTTMRGLHVPCSQCNHDWPPWTQLTPKDHWNKDTQMLCSEVRQSHIIPSDCLCGPTLVMKIMCFHPFIMKEIMAKVKHKVLSQKEHKSPFEGLSYCFLLRYPVEPLRRYVRYPCE